MHSFSNSLCAEFIVISTIIIFVVSVCPVLVVVGVGPPFHPSVPSSVPSSVHPSKFLIPEEEDDGRVYSYKEIGVGVLMQLLLIGWSPPLPTSIVGPSQGERMVGWST
jgi:hypothetical protein